MLQERLLPAPTGCSLQGDPLAAALDRAPKLPHSASARSVYADSLAGSPLRKAPSAEGWAHSRCSANVGPLARPLRPGCPSLREGECEWPGARAPAAWAQGWVDGWVGWCRDGH